MTEFGYLAFDADNHYYEATDAFTRYIDPQMAKRCMQWAGIGGKQRLIVAGRINRFIPNPTFDPVAKPGILDEYFRAKMSASWPRPTTSTVTPSTKTQWRPSAAKRGCRPITRTTCTSWPG